MDNAIEAIRRHYENRALKYYNSLRSIQKLEEFRNKGRVARQKGLPKKRIKGLRSEQEAWLSGWKEQDEIYSLALSTLIRKEILLYLDHFGYNQLMIEAGINQDWQYLLKTPIKEKVEKLLRKFQ